MTTIDDPATPADLTPIRLREPPKRRECAGLRGGLETEWNGRRQIYWAADGGETVFQDEAMRLWGRVVVVDGRMRRAI